jgi:hypothetical protein
MLHTAEGLADLIKMIANPSFQEQAAEVNKKDKASSASLGNALLAMNARAASRLALNPNLAKVLPTFVLALNHCQPTISRQRVGNPACTLSSPLCFKEIANLGIHAWVPEGPRKADSDIHAEEVLRCIKLGAEVRPARLLNLRKVRSKLPLKFLTQPPPGTDVNSRSFPYKAPSLFPLVVAKRSLGQNAKIDFLFNGEVLRRLASFMVASSANDQSAKSRLVATICNGTIIIESIRPHGATPSEIGMQFEALLTGRKLDARVSNVKFKNLRLIEFESGETRNFTVLFNGGFDAVDEEGHTVEIKSGNPKYLSGPRVVLQMIAGDCKTLVYAKRRGFDLLDVYRADLDTVIAGSGPLMTGKTSSPQQWCDDVQICLRMLWHHFFATGVGNIHETVEIVNRNGELSLAPCDDQILPPRKEVEAILSYD